MKSAHSSGSRRVPDLSTPNSQRSRGVGDHRLLSSSSDAKLGRLHGNGTTCVLDDPNLGVIAMNDHNVQACLCRYCSCGQHKCPGAPFYDPYPKSMYASQYQQAFVSGALTRPVPPPRPLPAKNLNQMDLLTIYEQDYRPFRVEGEDMMASPSRLESQGGFEGAGSAGKEWEEGRPGGLRGSQSGLGGEGSAQKGWPEGKVGGLRSSQSSRPQYRARPPKVAPFPKFSGVSSYHVEFPSWSSTNPYYTKRMYDHVPTREMPFEAKTNYADTFRPCGAKDPFTSKVAEMSKQGSLGRLDSNVKMFSKTSSGSAFQPIAKEFLGVRFPRKYERELTAGLAFATTEYQDKYVKQPPLMTNPLAVRRELDARASN